MMSTDIVQVFDQECRSAFLFLVEQYSFECLPLTETWPFRGYQISYLSASVAVQVSLDRMDELVEVFLKRLIEGKVPDYPAFIELDKPLNVFFLDDLIELRDPPLKVEQKAGTPLTEDRLKSCLWSYAEALKRCGTDVLRGDLHVFEQLERLVKNRKRK